MIKILCLSIILVCNIVILISSIARDHILKKMYKNILEEESEDKNGGTT